jgi:transcriptional regulator with XRE-family HTH domain
MVLIAAMTPFERKRLAAGLTQQQLGEKLGVTQGAVKKWENGLSLPSPKYFPMLAKLFRMSAEEVTHLFDSPASVA